MGQVATTTRTSSSLRISAKTFSLPTSLTLHLSMARLTIKSKGTQINLMVLVSMMIARCKVGSRGRIVAQGNRTTELRNGCQGNSTTISNTTSFLTTKCFKVHSWASLGTKTCHFSSSRPLFTCLLKIQTMHATSTDFWRPLHQR